jgi:hypothetical protein
LGGRFVRQAILLTAVAATAVTGACGSGKSGSGGSSGSSTGAGGAPGGGAAPGSGAASGGGGGTTGAVGAGPACSDLFAQDTLRTYEIDISPSEWQSLVAEFNDVTTLQAVGNDFVVRHPVVFHMGSETVSNATLKLHGQSSWAQTVMFDGARAKMQFDISFHQSDPNGKFHGVEKLVFDMPRDDWTFMHDRLAHAWFRQVGIAAGCAANAWVEINGSPYGLFVAEENTAKRVIKQFFPDNPGGDLWKGGIQPETNQAMPNWDRQKAFSSATSIADVSAIVDLQSSVVEWAGEALINSGDNYYGGNHNFYIYDQGAKGFVFLPNDTDSTFDYLVLNDMTPYNDDPIDWWQGRDQPVPPPGNVWLAVMNDPTWRGRYVDAIATQLGRWDVQQIQGWIDTWSQQIAADVAADPHAWATPQNFQDAVAAARSVVAQRAQFLQAFVDCAHGGGGAACASAH